MILQALVHHYENLLEKNKVSKEGWCQQTYLMRSICQKKEKLQALFH